MVSTLALAWAHTNIELILLSLRCDAVVEAQHYGGKTDEENWLNHWTHACLYSLTG